MGRASRFSMACKWHVAFRPCCGVLLWRFSQAKRGAMASSRKFYRGGGRPPAGGGRQAGREPKCFDKGRCWPAWCWEPGGGEPGLKIFTGKSRPPWALFGFGVARLPLPLRKGATRKPVATKAGPALPFPGSFPGALCHGWLNPLVGLLPVLNLEALAANP